MGRRDRGPAKTAILTVCTGNICRSPLAEQLLRAAVNYLRLQTEIEVGSAGLRAVVGSPMNADAARELLRLGGELPNTVGEQFSEGYAMAADLILTMTRGQRDSLVSKFPRVAKKSFTLAEFSRLANRILLTEGPYIAPLAALPALVERCALRRGSIELTELDDVPDPINAGTEVHRAAADQIAGYIRAMARMPG